MAMPSDSSVPFAVHGKTAIVTGAGSGINLCFTRLLLSRNCNVVLADLSLRPEAQKLVDEYSNKTANTPRAVFVKTDVVNFDQLNHMFTVAEHEFGGADIVCPGAGVFEPLWSNFWIPPGSEMSKDALHGTQTEGLGHYATLDINITHPIRCTQLAISRWLNPGPDSKTGKASPSNPKRVIHISSIAGQIPGFGTPLYHASKHAISGFIRSLAPLEDTLGIRVAGVAPGVIRTPIWTDHPEKLRVFDPEKDHWIEPEEVAEGMLRCLVDDGQHVKGGSVMEIMKDSFRNVDWRNDPGPSMTASGGTVSNVQVTVDDIFSSLAEPGWGMAGQGK